MATETLRPTADGATTDIIQPSFPANPHWSEVDEAIPDELTSFIAENNDQGFQTDTYITENISEGGDITITSVKVFIRFRSNNVSYPAKGKPVVRTGGTDYFGTEFNPSISWITYNYEWTVNPGTTNPWTKSEVNAMEIGVALDRAGIDAGDVSQCTQVYAEVTYEIHAVYTPVSTVITVPSITAIYGLVATATITALSLVVTVPPMTAVGDISATYTPISVLITIPDITADFIYWKNQSKSSPISPTNQSQNNISPTGQSKSSVVSFRNQKQS